MTAARIALDLLLMENQADAEVLDELTRLMTRELRELGVESIERPVGEAPPEDAKGDPFTWGALALAVLPTLIPELVKLLQSWVQRGEGRTVKIKTPAGLEVEFVAGAELTEEELASMVKRLARESDD